MPSLPAPRAPSLALATLVALAFERQPQHTHHVRFVVHQKDREFVHRTWPRFGRGGRSFQVNGERTAESPGSLSIVEAAVVQLDDLVGRYRLEAMAATG